MAEEKMQAPIKEILLDKNTFHGVKMVPTLINFIYGKNGTGKSTIADLIRTNTGISATDISNYEILVYDNNFINNNIKENSTLPGVFSLSEGNIKITEKVAKLSEELDELREKYKEIRDSISKKNTTLLTLKNTLESSCWDSTTDTRNSFAAALSGKRGRKSVFTEKLLTIIEPQKQDLTELQNLYNTAFDKDSTTYPFCQEGNMKPIQELKGMELLKQPILSSGDTPFAKFIQSLGATDWVKKGHDTYSRKAKGHCPYCNQTLPQDFEDQLAACFDEGYQSDINSIKDLKEKYNTETNKLLTTFNNNLETKFPYIDLTSYKEQLELLKKTIQLNEKLLEDKLDKPSSQVQLHDISALVNNLNSLVEDFNKAIKSNNYIIASLKEKQKECQERVWQHLAFQVRKELSEYHSRKEQIDDEILALEKEQSEVKNRGLSLSAKITQLNSQVVNIDSTMESINKELLDSGFQGFHLQKDKKDSTMYDIIRDDGSPARKLSEGERNFIAFLYFYHKVRGREHADSEFKDRIVVIDDPVSSMDSSSLFVVSAIIREMISICYNNGSASKPGAPHYIRQIFVLTHNAFFHKEVSYNQLKYYHCVNFYHLQKSHNVSSITLCVRQNVNGPAPALPQNYSPVQAPYVTLWKEYKEATSPAVLMQAARQILEYYFIQISGYDEQSLTNRIINSKDAFVETNPDGTENRGKRHLVEALLRFLGSEKYYFNDGLDYIEDSADMDEIRNTFKLIFDTMDQAQHYNMMIETA